MKSERLWMAARTAALGTGLIAAATFAVDYYRTQDLVLRDEASLMDRAMHEFYNCSIERSIEVVLEPMTVPERVAHFLETRGGYCVDQNRLEDHL